MDKTYTTSTNGNLLQCIKSKNILKYIFENIKKNKRLNLVKYNKSIQGRLEIGIDDYIKEYSKIEIEIIPKINMVTKFINITKEEDESHYHIYFNDDEFETKRTWLTFKENVSRIKIILDYEFKSFKRLFSDGKNIEQISFKKFNRKDITDMSNMFSYCNSLTNIDLSNFYTQNVTNMSYMFGYCNSLINIDLSNFYTQNVTNMSNMFIGCHSLKNIDLSNFNTQNVIDMQRMFEGCKSLKHIDLSNFNTHNVTNMRDMFYDCESLISIHLSNFNTRKVTDMQSMFEDCKSLISIDLSNFNTQKVTNMYCIFHCCPLNNIKTNDKNLIKAIKK